MDPAQQGVIAGPIAAALHAAAAALDPSPVAEARDGFIVWMADGHEFAILDGAVASLRLGPEVGAAARRTPDVGASSRGSDWITFSPPTLDGHARDRLVAWFAAAHRRAHRLTR